MDGPTEYWFLAYEAIRKGLITKDQALMIARPGTRKAMYWNRNIDNLKSYIEEMQNEKREAQEIIPS